MRSTAMTLTTLRLVVDSAVAELGHAPMPCQETILIRGGHFFGRQYRYVGVRAVWSADDEAVTIYAADDRVLKTLLGVAQPAPLRMAA